MKSGIGSCSLSSNAGELTACKLFSKLPGKRSAFNHTIRCSNAAIPSKDAVGGGGGGGEEGSWRAW